MQRAGGFFLALLAFAGIAVAGFFSLRPIITRKTVQITLAHPSDLPAPTLDGIKSAARFAIDAADYRAGPHKVAYEEITGIGDVSIMYEKNYISVHSAARLACHADVARLAAEWARREGARRVYLLEDPEPGPAGVVQRQFERWTDENGLEVVGRGDASTSSKDAVRRIVECRPNLLYYARQFDRFQKACEIYEAIRAQDYPLRFIVADATVEDSCLMHPAPEGTFLISPLVPPPSDFSGPFARFSGRPATPQAYCGYLAMKEVLASFENPAPTWFTPRPSTLYVARNGRFEFVQSLW